MRSYKGQIKIGSDLSTFRINLVSSLDIWEFTLLPFPIKKKMVVKTYAIFKTEMFVTTEKT